MTRHMRGMIVIGVIVGAMAIAAADPEPIRLTYSAPESCPSEQEVVAELRQHASIARVDSLAVRAFVLEIRRDDTGFHGELTVHDGGEAPGGREVEGGTCDEVVRALVLVTALAIEERAAAAPPPASPTVRQTSTTTHEPAWELAVGVGVGMYAGVTPSVRIGAPVSVAVSRGASQLRLVFDTTTRDDVAMAGFRWIAGRVELCPHVWQRGVVIAAPCGGIQLGAIDSEGTTGVAHATSDVRPWIAPEAVARAGVSFSRFAITGELGAAVPVERDRYYVAPATTIHQVPEVTWSAGIMLAYAFSVIK